MYFLLINYGIQNPPLNKRVGSSPTLGTTEFISSEVIQGFFIS